MTHMNSNIIQTFMNHIRKLGTEDFIKNMLLCFGAPTITGLKASCLINFRRHEHENIRLSWSLNADVWLEPLGLEWVLLGQPNELHSALVLIYRRELLARALGCDGACDILKKQGYPLRDVDACLECLRSRFCSGFPHEIGLFLDYPPEDVKGFMENRRAECSGYWKVYGNVSEAKIKFRKYKEAECDAALKILTGRQQI